jgi:hypothetical protein
MLQGPDVSRWQVVNWQVLAPYIDCAIVKSTGADAGYYVDSRYYYNRDNLRAIGKPRGWYHFSGASNPVAEADFFVNNTSWQPGEYMVCDREAPWPADVPGWCYQFLLRVKQRLPDAPLAIYMSGSRVTAYDWSGVRSLGAEIWIASYGSNSGRQEFIPNPGQWGVMWAHQFTSLFPLPPGVQSGGLDWNYFYSWNTSAPGESTMARLDDEDRQWLADMVRDTIRSEGVSGAGDLGRQLSFGGFSRTLADWVGGANVNSWLTLLRAPRMVRISDSLSPWVWWALSDDGRSRYWVIDSAAADALTGGLATRGLVPVQDFNSSHPMIAAAKQVGPTPPSWFAGSSENLKNPNSHIYMQTVFNEQHIVIPQMNPDQLVHSPGFSPEQPPPVVMLPDDSPVWDYPRFRVFRDSDTEGIYVSAVDIHSQVIGKVREHLSGPVYAALGYPSCEQPPAGDPLLSLPEGMVLPPAPIANDPEVPGTPVNYPDWGNFVVNLTTTTAAAAKEGGRQGAIEGTDGLSFTITRDDK